MAKVDFPEGNAPFFTPSAYANAGASIKRDNRKIKGRPKTNSFSTVLEGVATESAQQDPALTRLDPNASSEENLRLLLDEVHTTGEDLKVRASPDAIKRYKAAVRSFLHYIVENGYTVEEHVSGANILKRKKFTLIQVVDRKLEQLAAGILAGQQSQLDILARVDEINGLLVDLMR
jgi:uncharacterized protein YaaR (DUF327 family)